MASFEHSLRRTIESESSLISAVSRGSSSATRHEAVMILIQSQPRSRWNFSSLGAMEGSEAEREVATASQASQSALLTLPLRSWAPFIRSADQYSSHLACSLRIDFWLGYSPKLG
jgi:hypothetical protein